MRILCKDKWREGFLDYHKGEDENRIKVDALINLEKLGSLYFVRKRSIKKFLNYLFEVGFISLFHKIVSRSNEELRNEKYVSAGLGHILETTDDSCFCVGDPVIFLAPSHPKCAERITLPSVLVKKIAEKEAEFCKESMILFLPHEPAANDNFWKDLSGWNAFSGQQIKESEMSVVFEGILGLIKTANWSNAQSLEVSNKVNINVVMKAERKKNTSHRNAVLFGYGNYAKTNVLPNIKSFFDMLCIHEIDPTQMPFNVDRDKEWRTSHFPEKDERSYDVYFIAGFHHTHEPIAVFALENKAAAVVEKPIVVDAIQLNRLVETLKRTKGRLFSCFHKRYIPFNSFVFKDMNISPGEPISYHCIVYEVPLPQKHWYRWLNSKSRIISNGCHWVDHFLFLNHYKKPVEHHLFVSHDDTVNCSVTLENGAVFTMVLTDRGSERIGVQDYIELRNENVTVRMINGSSYISEGYDRIIRKVKINKMLSYRRMYKEISKKILDNESGDSPEEIGVSAGLILELEKAYQEYKVKQQTGMHSSSPRI